MSILVIEEPDGSQVRLETVPILIGFHLAIVCAACIVIITGDLPRSLAIGALVYVMRRVALIISMRWLDQQDKGEDAS